jgi:ABC-2 type transport system permease protein
MPIFDQGYQHWSGTLSGHAWRWLAITRHGLRVALAGRYVRRVLFLAWLPALALATALCLWGLLERQSETIELFRPILASFLDREMMTDPYAWRIDFWTLAYSYFMVVELWFSMILVVMIGPNLISQDLRYNALPLYFSRPLRRIDYFLGKLGVIVGLLSMVIIVPAIIAYLLGLLFSIDISILRDTFGLLLSVIAYGLVIAISAGLLILALSSLSRNSRYIALMWLGIWLIGNVTAGVLELLNQGQQVRRAYAASDEFQSQLLESAQSNWRPLVSYTANLSRLGQQLLGTDAVWDKLSLLRSENQRATFLVNFQGFHYPWYWSAAVLIGLAILSVCILKFSIRSLDRLK